MCIKIKICGFTRLEDAVAACELGADLLGFNFVPGSKRYIDPYSARGMIEAMPPFVSTVGIFAGEEVSMINDLAKFLGLDAVQLHGEESPDYCRRMDVPVIKALRVAEEADLGEVERYDVPAILLDARVPGEIGGTGQTFPWDLAEEVCRDKRVFVAGGLTPENVGKASAQAGLGIHVV